MGTPLYTTDVIPLTSRPTLTVMDDGDYFVILDTSTGKISKILRTNAQKALNISYDNATSGLTATQVQAALDELVVNLGSSDSAISALGGRLDILEGDDTTEGSVAKTVKDAVEPIIEDVSDHESRLDTTELTLARQGQDLASVKQTLQQGNGATLDFSDIGIVPLDARATGRANPTIYGSTVGSDSIQLPARVRSVGRNLTDIRSNVVLKANSRVSLVTEEGRTCWKINNLVINNVITGIFKPDTRYTIFMYGKQTTGGGRFGFLYTDGTYGYSQNFPTSFGLVVHVSTAGKTVQSIVCGFGDAGTWWVDVDTFMLHEGAVVLPYEPYKSSTLYIADNEELRSVPAIADEVKVVNGQLVKVQNVSEEVELILNGSQNWVESGSETFYRFFCDNLFSTHDIKINTASSAVASSVDADFPILSTPLATTRGINFNPSTKNRIYVAIDKSKVDAQAGATVTIKFKAYLNLYPITITRYALATPIITPLTTSGILQAKPNGTVYFEPYYEGSHQTDASAQITLPYEGTIEKVYGYDENLNEYLIDSSEYSLTGTTLTITDALENEVFFVQMSRSEPLSPEMSVNVINNEQVIADTENGKFYKLVPTITNGVLVNQTPVEVV